jgi:hypothetical protein
MAFLSKTIQRCQKDAGSVKTKSIFATARKARVRFAPLPARSRSWVTQNQVADLKGVSVAASYWYSWNSCSQLKLFAVGAPHINEVLAFPFNRA